jgi:hypothetical protein
MGEVPSPDEVRELKEVWDNLVFLDLAGALAGVAEVIRERRRQVEQIGWTPALDDGMVTGTLAVMARRRLDRVILGHRQGTADLGSDEDGLRRAAALAAAEIDRLNRMHAGE